MESVVRKIEAAIEAVSAARKAAYEDTRYSGTVVSDSLDMALTQLEFAINACREAN